MHYAPALVSTLGSGGSFLDRPLTAQEAAQLQQLLRVDATNYLYSACVSIGDAAQAIDRTLFTWATVKLYYSTFYLLRSLLALSGRALLYEGNKPRTLTCRAGEVPAPISAKGTHQAVIAYFGKTFPRSPLLSQDIGTDPPFQWLMHRREEANYNIARFVDPQCPAHFAAIVRLGVRRSTAEYVADSTYLYTFDPAHAILALPIEALKQAVSHPDLDITANCGADTRTFFQGLFADKSGPLSVVLHLLSV
jgi:hypothetical protein